MPPLSETPGLAPLLHPSSSTTTTTDKTSYHRKSSKFRGGDLLRMFKLVPMLSTGCKMVALLGRSASSPKMLADRATSVTLFGPRRGRICLAIQQDPRSPPYFLIELPILTTSLHKEMASTGPLKIALESETKTHKKKLVEEYVWVVYCNGRKSGFAIRRKSTSEDEREVMRVLRGVSMGAGVLPGDDSKEGEQLTYMRARFERVVGSKDSEALYMIDPNGGGVQGEADLSIFLVRVKT